MAPSRLLVAATLALAGTASAADIVWSVFAYIHHGERTPLTSPNGAALTPDGATSMQDLGSEFKARYRTKTSSHYVQGMSGNALDNTMLEISAADPQYITGSAMAFMQGLYPPNNQSFAYNDGGQEAATDSEDGSLVDFPLDGYQYPDIYAPRPTDEGSVWLQGHTACLAWKRDMPEILDLHSSDAGLKRIYEEVFPGVFADGLVSSENSYALWDYARYEHAHNTTVEALLSPRDLGFLEEVAFAKMYAENAARVGDGDDDDDEGQGMLGTVAGRMLATDIKEGFEDYYSSGGWTQRINLVFGSFEPLFAFAALAKLTGDSDGRGIGRNLFVGMPEYGSAMVFELYTPSGTGSAVVGEGGGNGELPPQDLLANLRVRMAWVDKVGEAWQENVPLFDENVGSMGWDRFGDEVKKVGVDDVAGWCRLCDVEDGFCAGYLLQQQLKEGGGKVGGGGGMVAPAVAGAIGIVAMALLVLVVACAAFFCGGFRLTRTGAAGRKGFRGESGTVGDEDGDVKVGRGGERKAKVGSWELRGGSGKTVGEDGWTEVVGSGRGSVGGSGGGGSGGGVGGFDFRLAEERINASEGSSNKPRGGGVLAGWGRRKEREEDEISVLGAQVHPRESV